MGGWGSSLGRAAVAHNIGRRVRGFKGRLPGRRIREEIPDARESRKLVAPRPVRRHSAAMAGKMVTQHTRAEVEGLLAALEGHADGVIEAAKLVSNKISEQEWHAYSAFRDRCDDFDTLAIVIEYRLKNLRGGRDAQLERQFEELQLFMLTATLQTSLHFLKILSQKNDLPLGSKDILLGELRSIYRVKQLLELDRYKTKISSRAAKDIETAEEILSLIIERAPSLLQLGVVEDA